MAFLYVREQQSVVRKRGERLVVQTKEETLADIPLRDITGVALFGSVQITTQAVGELCERNIPVALLTRSGRLKGRIVPELHDGAALRLEQYRQALVPEACLTVSKELIRAKLANSAFFIAKHRANHPSRTLEEAEGRLEGFARAAMEAEDHSQLLGLEGAGAAVYFEAFRVMNRSGLEFGGRQRPARDAVNALMNLTYTLLLAEIRGYLECAGLDAQIGMLHAVGEGRPSLGLDLMEPFRAPVADRFVLELLNLRVLGEGDFASHLVGRMEGRVALMPDALRRFLGRYEEFLAQKRVQAPEGFRAKLGEAVEGYLGYLRHGSRWTIYLDR